MSEQDFKILISTAPNQEVAESLASNLIEARLAACVNIVPQVTSIYEWQGKIERESEVILLIKSTAGNFSAIEKLLNEQHPYDVPELISCNIDEISASYGQWLKSAIDK